MMMTRVGTRHLADPGAAGARALAVVLAVVVLQLLTVLPVQAHGALERSSPGKGEHLLAAPREIRLTFSERIELTTARLRLEGPHGPVELDPIGLHPDSAVVLIVPIVGGLTSGAYRVQWQVAGADGHPVRGIFGFVIAPGAEGLAPIPAPGALPEPASHHPASSFPDGVAFDAGSAGYVVVRWLGFMALLGTIGAAAFRVVLSLAGRSREPECQVTLEAARRRTAGLGLWLTALLLGTSVLRLLAQSYALHGGGSVLDPGLLGAMITRTLWGWAWLLQVGAGLLALFGFRGAKRGNAGGWTLAGVAAVMLAFSPALSGHAAAVEALRPLPVIADGLHVLGAAGWLGALLGLLAVGIPVSRSLPGGRGGPMLAAVVNAYSPTALGFAALTVATGLFGSWLHLGGVAQLWHTTYGRTLVLKLVALAGVFGTGAYNWLRVRPALPAGQASGRLRRSGGAELVVGAVVLMITAVLVATSPPHGR